MWCGLIEANSHHGTRRVSGLGIVEVDIDGVKVRYKVGYKVDTLRKHDGG